MRVLAGLRGIVAPSVVVATIIASACGPQRAAPNPTPARGAGAGQTQTGQQGPGGGAGGSGQQGGPGAPAGEPNPRPYAQVITPGTRTHRGFIGTHEVRSRLYFEIPRRELGKDMLIVSSLRGAPRPLPVIGTLGGNRLIRWERRDNRILLRAVNHQNVSTDSTSPFNRALPIVQFAPILASFNVESYGADSAAVIDVTRLFTGGVPEFLALGQRATTDASRSFVESARAFEKNVAVIASQTFTPQPTPGSTPPGTPPPTATSELYHFSMVKLPDNPMMPRLHDERVGYFGVQQLDWGSREQRVARRRLIARWRLECSDQKVGELCVPKKPITYYVDPATPTWLVPFVKKGIEEWQAAFRDAGFHNGIVAAEAPRDDLDFSGEDATVAMVRWVPSSIQNAIGPSTVDPRSGEILDADVQMLHNIMNLQRNWYFTQVGHLDSRVHQLPMPDSLMGRLVQFVVAHEVGHTLGFPHNMKASSMYPLDSLRSPTWTARMGHSPSVMDYARFNYVAQPGDGIALEDLVPRVGPYDRYAVMWGYKPIPGATTPEQEKPTLNQWAAMQDTIPWLRFRADDGNQGPDPGEASEAIGDQDAVRATALGIANIKRVVRLVEPATTHLAGERYDDLAELYGAVIGQWATELRHVARIPGGVYHQHKVTGQEGPRYAPIAAARQRQAVAFLNENAFATPTFFLDTSLLRKVEASGSVDRIGNAQRSILNVLLANDRLARMIELEALAGRGGRAYTLAEMLGDVRRGVWSEIYRSAPIDAYRRRLQRSYLELLAAKINPPPVTAIAGPGGGGGFGAQPPVNIGDARALLRGELMDLDRQLAAAIPGTSDRTTRLHLLDARDQIDRILNPER